MTKTGRRLREDGDASESKSVEKTPQDDVREDGDAAESESARKTKTRLFIGRDDGSR